MAFGAEVGQGHVSIFPSMKGFRSAVNKEMDAAGRQGSARLSKAFDGKGMGSRLGGGLKSGFAAGTQGLADSVLKPFRQDVAKAANSYSSALLKQKDAALNVRDAQEKLAAAIAKHGEGSIQAEKAAVRLETAQLREGTAADNVRAATERLSDAKSRLSVAENAAAQASKTSMSGFKAQLSGFAAGFKWMDSGRSMATGMAQSLGGLARAMLGLNQMQPVVSRIGSYVKSGLGSLGGFTVQLGAKMSTGLQGAVRATQSTLSGWGDSLGAVASRAAAYIPQPFKSVAGTIGGYLSGIGSAAGGVLGEIPATAKNVASRIASSFQAGAAKAAEALKGIATVSMAGVAAGVTALIPAIAKIGRSAFDAYATYEQAVGGIDTLFKSSSATVQKYAAQAYRTAGVSANDYMTQITSFSASLISSLGGDTAKAADMGNMALTDMSDNANKMGTDLGSIQQTYQSLARGNYAMLDNLKLGYGGTKTEMERMIADANKVRQANGQMADLSVDRFSDVVQAIHIMQTQMGITGTTSREAATTIEGSIGSMKAAWSNWLTELGKNDADIPGLTNQLAESIGTALRNILPRVGVIAKSVIASIPAMFSSLTQLLPAPFQKAINAIGDTISGFGNVLAPLTAGFAALGIGGLTPLLEKIPLLGGLFGKLAGPLRILGGPIGIITAALAALIATSPALQSTFGDVLGGVFNGLEQQFQLLLPSLQQLWASLQDAMTTIMPVLIQAMQAILPAIGQVVTAILPLIGQVLPPLLDAIGMLIPPVMQIIEAILPTLTQLVTGLAPVISQVIGVIAGVVGALLPVVTGVVSTIAGFITGVVIPTVTGMMPVVQSVIGTIAAVVRNIVGVVRGVVDIVAGILTGDWSRVWNGITGVVSNAIGAVGHIVGGVIDVGRNLVKGIWNGISSMAGWLWDKIGGWAGSVIDKVKNVFGIHSPSRVFRDQIGVMLAKGMALGVDDGTPAVSHAVQALTGILPDDMSVGVTANTTKGSQNTTGQANGKTTIVHTSIDARGTDPDTLLDIWSTRAKSAADRW